MRIGNRRDAFEPRHAIRQKQENFFMQQEQQTAPAEETVETPQEPNTERQGDHAKSESEAAQSEDSSN